MRIVRFSLGNATPLGGRAMIGGVLLAATAAAALTVGVDWDRKQAPPADTGVTVSANLARHPEEARRAVKDYLARNPEVLQEALVELMKVRLPARRDTATLVKSNGAVLFGSANRVPLGNPNGDVTLVEFVDYNCGFCRRALGDMLQLIREDAHLKVVLVEHPVLGASSVETARVAIALQMQDRGAAKHLAFHRKLLAGPGPANKARALAVAAELGFDGARLEADAATLEVGAMLDESKKLARALGIRGTPSYVIGDSVLFGTVGVATLKDRIAAARQNR